MRVIFDPKEPLGAKSVATVGVFDGVHLGHKRVLRLVVGAAKEKGLNSLVLTFHPHPQKVLAGDDIPLIVPLEERFRLLEKEGIETVVCYIFNQEFASISAEDFVKDILVQKLGIKRIFASADFRFGHDRGGDFKLLQKMGRIYDFEISLIETEAVEGEVVSSTAIRELLETGNVKKAARFLGRLFSIEGRVVEGDRRGKELGFPTANLNIEWELFPKGGVYVTWAYLAERKLESITNIGYRPTFGGKKLILETHIIGFEEDIYGETLRIEFIERLRDERPFESIDALRAQITRDVERAKSTVFDKSR